jgi:hypothetical protein
MIGFTATGLLGDSSGSVWVLLAISWLLAGLLMWIGTRMAGLKYVTFGRCIIAAFAASGVAWVCMTLFADVPLAGISLGAVLALLLSWFAIKEVLNTSPGPALLVWAFDVFAQLIAGFMGISGVGVELRHLFR